VTGASAEFEDARSAVAAVAALADRLRADLYRFVRGQGGPVTRDDAAASAGISRKLAAFHLDKLVAVGLLRASYERTDRAATIGRSPKVYEPSDVDVHVQVPERRYDLAAEILLDALAASGAQDTTDQGPGGSPVQEAFAAARSRGQEIGQAARPASPGGRVGRERGLRAAETALSRCGYEPSRPDQGSVVLGNCPFHQLVQRQRDLVCRLNHAFCAGLVDGIGASAVSAVLVPTAPHCCVELRTS
jgi:predicted ArsR family transcriptional regulator